MGGFKPKNLLYDPESSENNFDGIQTKKLRKKSQNYKGKREKKRILNRFAVVEFQD